MNNRNKSLVLVAIALIASFIFSLLTIYAVSEFEREDKRKLGVSARSAVLYVPEADRFLYEKHSELRLPMASTTKIMTALIAAESLPLSEVITVDERASGIEGSSAYLKVGERVTAEELMYALMLRSANDAAAALAIRISGGIEDFAALMNGRAEELGLTDTHFTNPHGLDDDEHYTTARDLAILASAALKNELVRKISSTYKKSFITEERSRTYVNHNKLLLQYDDAIGLKTGFTKKSGRCLVGAAERDGLTLVTVTLDAPSDWNDHRNMLDYGFSHIEKLTLANEGDISYTLPILGAETDSVRVSNREAASVICDACEHEVKSYVRMSRILIAPISTDTQVGTVIFTLDGEECARIALYPEESIKTKKDNNLLRKHLTWKKSDFRNIWRMRD